MKMPIYLRRNEQLICVLQVRSTEVSDAGNLEHTGNKTLPICVWCAVMFQRVSSELLLSLACVSLIT
jgi:hypothetical protein